MDGLLPDWRELEREDQRRALEKDLRKEVEALETSNGSQALADLRKDIELAEMRMEDSGHPLDLNEADPRLRHYRPIGILTFLIVPSVNEQSKTLAYELLMECANAGFVVGHESAKGRWKPKSLTQSSLWTRIFNPRKALLESLTEAIGDLTFQLTGAQDGVVEEVGVDPPWKTESRLTLQMVTSIAVLINIDPTERRLEGVILDMLRTGLLIGRFSAICQWPPDAATGDELERLHERLSGLYEAGSTLYETHGSR